MPETIRTANERLRSRPWRGGFLAAFVTVNLLSAFSTPARAETEPTRAVARAVSDLAMGVGQRELATLTLTLGLVCFALYAVIVLLRTRRTASHHQAVSREEASALHAEIDRLKALLLAEPQVLVAWPAGADQPEILGDATAIAPGAAGERVLAFGTWLEPEAAQEMERAVETLRERRARLRHEFDHHRRAAGRSRRPRHRRQGRSAPAQRRWHRARIDRSGRRA